MRLRSNVTRPPNLRLLYPPATGILTEVSLDEPVYLVQESNAIADDGSEHRFQVLFVPVNGEFISTFLTDMGPAANYTMTVDDTVYPTPPYQQPILMEHTVAECRDMADDFRDDDFAVQLLHNQTNESDIIARYWAMIEEDRSIVKNKSTFGPGGHIQRNSFSDSGARLQKERLESEGTVPHHGYYR